MKDYVEWNIAKRRISTSDVDKQLYKDKLNKLFGIKTMNEVNRRDLKVEINAVETMKQRQAFYNRVIARQNARLLDVDRYMIGESSIAFYDVDALKERLDTHLVREINNINNRPNLSETQRQICIQRRQEICDSKKAYLDDGHTNLTKNTKKRFGKIASRSIVSSYDCSQNDEMQWMTDEYVPDTENSITRIVSYAKKKTIIKANRGIGAHILARSKTSIARPVQLFKQIMEEKLTLPFDNFTTTVQLHLTDTDSFFVGVYVATPSTNKELLSHSEFRRIVHNTYHKEMNSYVDTSNIDENDIYYDISRKKQLSLFQMELLEKGLAKLVVATNPKEYYTVFKDATISSKQKGLKKNVSISLSQRLEALPSLQQLLVSGNYHALYRHKVVVGNIQVRNKNVVTSLMEKVVNSQLNRKNFYLSDGITSVPHGHFLCRTILNQISRPNTIIENNKNLYKESNIERRVIDEYIGDNIAVQKINLYSLIMTEVLKKILYD